MSRLGWAALAALLMVLLLRYGMGYQWGDFLWDVCNPPPPQAEIPWPTGKPCKEVPR